MHPILGNLTLLLSRWQFATTTIYHFLFVPVTIGLSVLVAILQSAYYKTHDERYDRLVSFFGKLFLINFAIGVVTGIVQEFQFGMNWSQYSAFVGNIFGPPLAIEGLLAFFMESTFLGIWIFGKGRVSERVHLFSIWMASFGTVLSASFILAANSWMQHPVGYSIDKATHQAVMTNFWAILTNSLFLVTLFHTLLAAAMTAAALMLGISFYQMKRKATKDIFALGARVALIVLFVSSLAMALDGHVQGQVMVQDQPMKMAAGEALYNTERGASESLLTIGNLHDKVIFEIGLPHVLSLLATDKWNGTVQGINQLQAKYEREYGKGNYVPIVWLDYWSFRIMAGIGAVILAFGAWGMYLLRKKRLDDSKWFRWAAIAMVPLPFIANTTGWIFQETGRQPWVVYGLLKTSQAVSNLSAFEVGITLVGFTALYGLLATVDISLMLKYAKKEIQAIGEGDKGLSLHHDDEMEDEELGSLVY
jgi:cytochrome d ubiquinol oxidase subunit I